MRKNTPPWYVNTLVNWGVISAAVGITWLYAMVFNPNIDSGTVWLLGLLFGGIEAQLARVIYTLEA